MDQKEMEFLKQNVPESAISQLMKLESWVLVMPAAVCQW